MIEEYEEEDGQQGQENAGKSGMDEKARKQHQELVEQFKSDIAVWDMFPAFWYNTQTISQVIRLYCISDKSVQGAILRIWQNGITDDSEFSVASRVARVCFGF